MAEAYIVDALRSPTGKRKGGLAHVHAIDLGAHVLKALVERNPGVDFGAVEFETRVAGDRRRHHRQALRGAGLRRLTRHRLPGGNPANLREAQAVGGFLGQAQMAVMHRVERPAEDPERQAVRFAGRWAAGVRRSHRRSRRRHGS